MGDKCIEREGQPLVSLILCIYNVERYIEKSVTSVLGQTYTNIEFIFIDDGSPDRSMDILSDVVARYPHLQSRIRIIRRENQGVSSARRLGISEARGSFILFSDPDDWCHPKLVELLVKKAVKEKADMVICNYWCVYSHYMTPRREKRFATKKEMLRALSTHHHLRGYVWNKLVRRDVYRQCIDFIPPTRHCEDLMLIIPALFLSGKVVYLRRRLCYYRRSNPGAVSKSDPRDRTLGVVLNTMELFMKWKPFHPSPVTGIEEDVLLSVAIQICRIDMPELLEKYPIIRETLLPVVPNLPSERYRDDLTFEDQRRVKQFFSYIAG